eukprot:680011-Heterocapsa_arctica.AAC.1
MKSRRLKSEARWPGATVGRASENRDGGKIDGGSDARPVVPVTSHVNVGADAPPTRKAKQVRGAFARTWVTCRSSEVGRRNDE